MRRRGLTLAGPRFATDCRDVTRAWRHARLLPQFLAEEQERWFLWVPVLLAFGVAAYFALPREPLLPALLGLQIFLLACLWWQRRALTAFLLLAALAAFSSGLLLAKLRTDLLEAPRLVRDMNGVFVKGWVEAAETRDKGRVRLQIRVHDISRLAAGETPARILVSLRKACADDLCVPGATIGLLAFLRLLPDPVMPGAYDYAREAYFEQIGATGFAPRPPEAWNDAPEAGFALRYAAAVQRLRAAMTARITEALPGDTGAIAAALLTGIRSGIGEEPLNALRIAGLAHILAISGLHMSLMAGSLFWLIRALLAMNQHAALHLPVKKIAAFIALTGAAAYLVISGSGISTQRAFIMIAIMFVAIMLGRPALSMRNLASAAILVILLRPESILTASFQMSFAATLGLIAAYERRPLRNAETSTHVPRWIWPLRIVFFYFAAMCVTTIVASAATAPFAAYHFSRLAPFSILGNLMAMPLVGFVIMPAGLAALVALPFGLEPLPLALMGWGIDRLIAAAHMVAMLPGADSHVARMPVASLLLIVVGCLWLALWRRWWRWLAVLPAFAAVPVAYAARPPDILIDAAGRAVAVRRAGTGQLDVLDLTRSQFSASRWLAADGDERAGGKVEAQSFSCDALACIAPLPQGGHIAVVRHRAALAEECAGARIVVTAFELAGTCKGPELVFDAAELRRFGARAIFINGTGMKVESARPKAGARPWWPQGEAPDVPSDNAGQDG